MSIVQLSRFPLSVVLFGSVIAVSGCDVNQTGVSALDDLTASTDTDGALSKPVNLKYPLQTRFLAANGLLPVSGPGSACIASGMRSSSSIICYSDSGNTEVAYRHFETDATLADLLEIRDDLQTLQYRVINLLEGEDKDDKGESQSNPAEAPGGSAEDIIRDAEAIRESAAKKNVFVFRWASGGSAGGGGGIGELFNGESSLGSSQSGIVIVGGLVLSQLLIGRDDYEKVLSGYSKGTKIATLTMGAEHLVYVADANLSGAIAAALDSDLDDLSHKLSPSTELALRAYASIGQAQENHGSFTAAKIESSSLLDYRQNRPVEHIFYSTLTDVEKLTETLEN